MIFAFDMHVYTGFSFTELCYKLNITIHTAECPRHLDLCFRTAYGTILYICCTGSVFQGGLMWSNHPELTWTWPVGFINVVWGGSVTSNSLELTWNGSSSVWSNRSELTRTTPGVFFFFWTHFRLSLRTAVHMRMRSATPSAYLDLWEGRLPRSLQLEGKLLLRWFLAKILEPKTTMYF